MSTSLSCMAVATFVLAPAFLLPAAAEAWEIAPPTEPAPRVQPADGGAASPGGGRGGPGGGMGYEWLDRLLQW